MYGPTNLPDRSTGFSVFVWSAIVPCLLALLTFTAYSNTLHVPFILDDLPNIKHNELVFRFDEFTFQNIKRFWISRFERGRPVALFTFALNFCFGRLDPTGYHLVNVAIHLLSGAGVFFFTRLLLIRSPVLLSWTPGDEQVGPVANLIASCTALIWTLHPVQTASVTYIVQRMTSLAGMFYFWGLYLYLKRMFSTSPSGKAVFFLLVVLFFFLGVGSKEIVATFPLAIWLVNWLFFPNHQLLGDNKSLHLLGILLFVALLGGFFLMDRGGIVDIFNKLFRGSAYPYRHWSTGERLLTESRVVVRYLFILLLPFPFMLNLERNPQVSTGLFSPPSTVACLLLILLLIWLAFRYRRSRVVVSFGIFWFGLHLLITSTIVPLELMFDHRLYLPSFGVVFPLVYGAVTYIRIPYWYQMGLGILISLLLGTSTYMRNQDWSSWISIYRDATNKAPEKPRAQGNLAAGYIRKAKKLLQSGKLDRAHDLLIRARDRFEKAHRLVKKTNRPNEPTYEQGITESTALLAMVELERGQVAAALDYVRTIDSKGENTTSEGSMHIARGQIHQGHYFVAIKHILSGLGKNPDAFTPYQMLALAYLEKGRSKVARDILTRAPPPENRTEKLMKNTLLGNCFINSGNRRKANRFLTAARRIAGKRTNGDDAEIDTKARADMHAALARYHHEFTGKIQKRRKHARASLELVEAIEEEEKLRSWAEEHEPGNK